MCNRIKVHFCQCNHHGYMSIKACDHTVATGIKCSTGSEYIHWLCAGFEFRVAAVCWHKQQCRTNAVGVRLHVRAVPPPPTLLSTTDQLRALKFLLAEYSFLYVPYCQQQVLDGHFTGLPTWRAEDIAIPSVEPNWFDEEKISILDLPHLGTPEHSRDLVALLGTAAETETESGDDRLDDGS